MHKKRIFLSVAVFLVGFLFFYFFIAEKNKNNLVSLVDKKNKAKNVTKIDDSKIGEQCFNNLKENMKEASVFESPLQEVEKMTYKDLSAKFSRNYKELSSFGLEIDRGDLEMRLYSFGNQTGYVHPPITPFPSSTESEMWDEPAKEFILAEEYVVNNEGEKKFLNCSFMRISSEDLMKVTRENYLYDGAMVSLNKVAKDNSYKAWYSENVSFDYSGKPLASFSRIFVYPQLSQNEYFDRYTVAEAYPGNKVESFDILKFFLQPMIRFQEYGEKNEVKTKIITFDESGKEKEIIMPKELEPIKYEGVNELFPMSGYYQAIENQFPEFAKLLSFRGSLKYKTFKELISGKQDPEVEKILVALSDYRQLINYELNKKANEKNGGVMTDPDMDKLLLSVKDADKVVAEIKGINPKNDESNIEKDGIKNNKVIRSYLAIIFSIFLIGVLLLYVIFKIRK